MFTLNAISSRPEFADFSRYYDEELQPLLARRESLRRKSVTRAGVIFAVAGAVAAAIFVSIRGDIGQTIAMIIGFLGFGGAAALLNRARSQITNDVLGNVVTRLGFRYQRKCERPDFCEVFQRYKLFGRFNREHWEDRVEGERNGSNFTLIETHLKYRSGGKNKNTRTIFHGQLLVIDYHRKFLGETIIKRDAGLMNRFNAPGKEFKQVGLASSKFEKIFEAWSTDQVEARTLLDPLMLERFEELDRLFNGAKFRAAFCDGKVYIALQVGDKLNIGSMFSRLDNPERIASIVREFDLVFDLIDVLTKSLSGRIDGAFSVDAVRAS